MMRIIAKSGFTIRNVKWSEVSVPRQPQGCRHIPLSLPPSLSPPLAIAVAVNFTLDLKG